jgi:hypothetical protein
LAPFEQITRDIKGLSKDGNEMVLERDQRGGGEQEGTPPLGPQCFTKPLGVHTYIYVLLVVKCIPKFNFVGFAMSHFDWNHHKEIFFETFRHFA